MASESRKEIITLIDPIAITDKGLLPKGSIGDYFPVWEKVTWDVQEAVIFAFMARDFLESTIRSDNLNARLELFIREIYSLFVVHIGYDTIVSKYESSDLSHEFQENISTQTMIDINNQIKNNIAKYPMFRNLWDYYVVNHGVEMDWRALTELENWDNRAPGQYYVSPWVALYNNIPPEEMVDPDQIVIPLDYTQDKIYANLQKELWSVDLMSYIADLLKNNPQHNIKSIHKLTEVLYSELVKQNRSDWYVLIIATVISYYTDSEYVFNRMMMYKYASINSIVENIANSSDYQMPEAGQVIDYNADRMWTWFNEINKDNYRMYLHALSLTALINFFAEDAINEPKKEVKSDFLKLWRQLLQWCVELMKSDKQMDYETIDALMQSEYDAWNMAQEYYTHSDQGVDQEDIENEVDDEKNSDFRYYTEWMLETSKLPEEEKREIILEEAIYQDPGFSSIKDVFALTSDRMQYYNDAQLLKIIEWVSRENMSAVKKYVALILYAFNADSIHGAHERISENSHIFDILAAKIDDIDASLEIRYEDFEFTGELKRQMFEYTIMILQHRIENILAYAEQVESISEWGDGGPISEFNLFSDFIIAFACEEDQLELRQMFGEYWNLVYFNYLDENENRGDDDDSDEESYT